MKKSLLPICTDFMIIENETVAGKSLAKTIFLDKEESSRSYVLYNRKNSIPFSHE